MRTASRNESNTELRRVRWRFRRAGGARAQRRCVRPASAVGRAGCVDTRRRRHSDPGRRRAQGLAGDQSHRHAGAAAAARRGAAPGRSAASPVRPRRLSHVLLFSRDVPAQTAFYERVLGLRLSDRSAEIIAFLHGPHASDHHLLAFAKSEAPGLHHELDVGRFDDVGLGAELMEGQGIRPWVGRRPARARLELLLLRAGSMGRAGRGRIIDFVPATSTGRRHIRRTFFYILGADVPRRLHRQSRERDPPAGAEGWIVAEGIGRVFGNPALGAPIRPNPSRGRQQGSCVFPRPVGGVDMLLGAVQDAT